jgi:hypothetical protein
MLIERVRPVSRARAHARGTSMSDSRHVSACHSDSRGFVTLIQLRSSDSRAQKGKARRLRARALIPGLANVTDVGHVRSWLVFLAECERMG